jgi:hypothetical protein
MTFDEESLPPKLSQEELIERALALQKTLISQGPIRATDALDILLLLATSGAVQLNVDFQQFIFGCVHHYNQAQRSSFNSGVKTREKS